MMVWDWLETFFHGVFTPKPVDPFAGRTGPYHCLECDELMTKEVWLKYVPCPARAGNTTKVEGSMAALRIEQLGHALPSAEALVLSPVEPKKKN